MRVLLITLLIFLNCPILFSQIAADTVLSITEQAELNYVYTTNGNTLTGKTIEIEKNSISTFLIIDSIKIDFSLVKFISYDGIFFATLKQGNSGNSILLPRIYEGNMNIYSDTREVLERDLTGLYLSSGQLWGDYITRTRKYESNYYNKGFGNLKVCKYKNLFYDLSDNSLSMKLLNQSVTSKNTGVCFYITGIASIFYGFNYAFNYRNKEDHSFNALNVVLPFGVGLGSLWLGSSFANKSERFMDEAIKAY